jgi:hypothetical protein
MSDRVPYRTLQAICDLRSVARLSGDATRARIAAGTNGEFAAEDLANLIEAEGCRIARPQTQRLHQALVLAAALPNDDFDAFQISTAILIADRLQRGLGQDDLFWHWDAFRDHYRIAPPHVRAALMNGYHRMEAEGLVSLEDPPEPADLVTESRAAVEAALAPERGESVRAIAAAVAGGEVGPDFWARHCLPNLDAATPPALFRGIRHVLENRPDWEPWGEARFDPADEGHPVIPVILP